MQCKVASAVHSTSPTTTLLLLLLLLLLLHSKILFTTDLQALKLHYTSDKYLWTLENNMGKDLSYNAYEQDAMVVIASCSISFVLVQGENVGIMHVFQSLFSSRDRGAHTDVTATLASHTFTICSGISSFQADFPQARHLMASLSSFSVAFYDR